MNYAMYFSECRNDKAQSNEPWAINFFLAAQFALTSRAYHNSSSFWLTLQVKSVAICAECVTHWYV